MSREFRLGVFIVVALLLFAAGVFWIGSNEMLFRSKYRLNAEFKTVAGLEGGAAVRVAGIQKGTVRRIDLPASAAQKHESKGTLTAKLARSSGKTRRRPYKLRASWVTNTSRFR